MREVAHLSAVLAPEGRCFASSAPVDSRDPGRFNALFGRDSLITALQLLEVRPDVARSTLGTLAALQGCVRGAGRGDDAERLRRGVVDALARLGDPVECYAAGPDGPHVISSANRVQAWTVGAAFALERQWDGRAQTLFA